MEGLICPGRSSRPPPMPLPLPLHSAACSRPPPPVLTSLPIQSNYSTPNRSSTPHQPPTSLASSNSTLKTPEMAWVCQWPGRSTASAYATMGFAFCQMSLGDSEQMERIPGSERMWSRFRFRCRCHGIISRSRKMWAASRRYVCLPFRNTVWYFVLNFECKADNMLGAWPFRIHRLNTFLPLVVGVCATMAIHRNLWGWLYYSTHRYGTCAWLDQT